MVQPENTFQTPHCVEELPEMLGVSRFAAYRSTDEDTDTNMFSEYPDVLTVDQLMEMLHIGRNAAYSLLKSGEIKTLRIGRRYIIPRKSIVAYILSV